MFSTAPNYLKRLLIKSQLKRAAARGAMVWGLGAAWRSTTARTNDKQSFTYGGSVRSRITVNYKYKLAT
jgi:hypothetical protein